MNPTVKTVLIVGGVAVGVVLLFKVLSPSPAAAARPAPKPTDAISLNGIIGLGTSLFSAFGGSSSGAPVLYDSPGGFVATREEWKNVADYNAQPGQQYGIAGIDY